MIISELLRKWFGLPSPACETCEVLRIQLARSERKCDELLEKLLSKQETEPIPVDKEELQPIKTTNFVPWHIRQQMLEAEDRKKAELVKQREKEIAALERELGIGGNRDDLSVRNTNDSEQEERIG